MIRITSLVLLLASVIACGRTVETSPETIVTNYIQHLYSSDFTAAAAQCTPAGAAYISALQAIMTATEEAPDSSGVQIESIQCAIRKDTIADCTAIIDDGFEQYAEDYSLRLRSRQWLIHHESDAGETTTSQETLSPSEN